MSLHTADNGTLTHFPANPEQFAFDAEVSSIFDSMALRSIPNYAEAHRLHAALALPHLKPGAVLADVGASTGNFFKALSAYAGRPLLQLGLETHAYDTSEHMMRELSSRFPSVTGHTCDIATAPDLPRPANVIVCLYVLQFLPSSARQRALDWLQRNLAPRGMLILGQKETSPWRYENAWVEEYHAFRRANGYTQAEIDAKTRALAGAMWPVSCETLTHELDQRGLSYTETTRWMQFTTGVSTQRG